MSVCVLWMKLCSERSSKDYEKNADFVSQGENSGWYSKLAHPNGSLDTIWIAAHDIKCFCLLKANLYHSGQTPGHNYCICHGGLVLVSREREKGKTAQNIPLQRKTSPDTLDRGSCPWVLPPEGTTQIWLATTNGD